MPLAEDNGERHSFDQLFVVPLPQQALLAALEMLDAPAVEVTPGLVEEAGVDGISILLPPANGKDEAD